MPSVMEPGTPASCGVGGAHNVSCVVIGRNAAALARGRTYAGKSLWILVKYRGRGVASLITAREDR